MAVENNYTNIYETFIKPNGVKIKFNNRRKNHTHKLPFVGAVDGKLGLSFWKVPSTGSYAGGCKTGENLIYIYLKHLRSGHSSPGGSLQSIVLSMLELANDNNLDQNDALIGQIVGFFSGLESVLADAAKSWNGLDGLSNKQLLHAANLGLNFDIDAFHASLPDQD